MCRFALTEIQRGASVLAETRTQLLSAQLSSKTRLTAAAMSDLLIAWLNHELRLSAVVTDVERDFASGFLLGELLFRLNHQPNFADFIAGTSADAKIVNFCLLEPSLRSMGVRFDAAAATAIMNGVKGAAASLLYQIKVLMLLPLLLCRQETLYQQLRGYPGRLTHSRGDCASECMADGCEPDRQSAARVHAVA